jgi:hypothetical protein
MRNLTLAMILVLAAACGGKAKNGGGPVADHAAHHDNLAPELAKFNDAIGPTWHAPKGEQRAKDACAAADQLDANAGEAAMMAVPAGADSERWAAGMKELTDAVAELKAGCAADAATAEPALERVHEALHALIGMSGGHHEADGTHPHR